MDRSIRFEKNQPGCGAFLSGGIDSSTVAGVMSKVDPDVATFSIGFEHKDYDETPYARLSAKHFNTKHHEYFVTPEDVVEAIPKIAESFDEPFGNSSGRPTYLCAKFAKQHGINKMFAGDGGDELFAGNQRYATQRYYHYYLNLPLTLRTAALDPLIRLLPDFFPLASKAKTIFSKQKSPCLIGCKFIIFCTAIIRQRYLPATF